MTYNEWKVPLAILHLPNLKNEKNNYNLIINTVL